MVNLIYRETHSYMHIYTDIYNFAQFTDLLFRHVRYSASNGNMMENYVSSLCNYFLNVCQSEFVSQSVYLSFHLLSIFSVYIIIIYIYIYIYTALCIFSLLYNEFLMRNSHQLFVSLRRFFSFLLGYTLPLKSLG